MVQKKDQEIAATLLQIPLSPDATETSECPGSSMEFPDPQNVLVEMILENCYRTLINTT